MSLLASLSACQRAGGISSGATCFSALPGKQGRTPASPASHSVVVPALGKGRGGGLCRVPCSCSPGLDPSLISCGNAPGTFLETSNSRQLLLEISPVQGFERVSCVLSLKAIAEYFLEMWGQPGECTCEFTLLLPQKGTSRRVRSLPGPREGHRQPRHLHSAFCPPMPQVLQEGQSLRFTLGTGAAQAQLLLSRFHPFNLHTPAPSTRRGSRWELRECQLL